jgi:hypothetical protein
MIMLSSGEFGDPFANLRHRQPNDFDHIQTSGGRQDFVLPVAVRHLTIPSVADQDNRFEARHHGTCGLVRFRKSQFDDAACHVGGRISLAQKPSPRPSQKQWQLGAIILHGSRPHLISKRN